MFLFIYLEIHIRFYLSHVYINTEIKRYFTLNKKIVVIYIHFFNYKIINYIKHNINA
jgi:hypothetical protein